MGEESGQVDVRLGERDMQRLPRTEVQVVHCSTLGDALFNLDYDYTYLWP